MVRNAMIFPTVAPYLHAVVYVYFSIVHGCHQCNRLEGRTWLHALYGMIGQLVVLLIATAIQVAYGFYLACFHFHQYYATPICLILGDLLAQTTFADVHEVSVQCGVNIGTFLSLAYGYILATTRDMLFATQAVCASQILLKAFFNTRSTISLLSMDSANGATAQTAEGFRTAIRLGEINATLVVSSAHQWQLFDGFLLGIRYARIGKANIAFATGATAKSGYHFFAILFRCLVAQYLAKAVCH